MEYPQHYTGIAEVYDIGKLNKGVSSTYKVTKAIRRLQPQNEMAFDLQSEDGTRLSFTLKSLDGKWFSGQSGEVTISQVAVMEEEELCMVVGRWKESQREECTWIAELSLDSPSLWARDSL